MAVFPVEKIRNPNQTVELAKKAVELAPEDGSFWNTLGVAQYRAGHWNAAIEALEKSMELRKGGDASDWFFLAMAHWQLGHKDEARKWYDKAVEWMDKNQPKNDELRRFRAEAAELLGITEPKSSTDLQPATRRQPANTRIPDTTSTPRQLTTNPTKTAGESPAGKADLSPAY